MTDTLTTPQPLTRAERCDQCNAAAQIRAIKNGTQLLFCQHHANKHLNKLTEQEWTIHNN